MRERRKGPRIRADNFAFIMTKVGNPIACRVEDRSEDGARLIVDSIFGIPDEFRLMIETTGEGVLAMVAWRAPRELGVAFPPKPHDLRLNRHSDSDSS